MWHSSLTDSNRQDIERIQKAALKVILRGDYTSYEQALEVLNLDSLNQRREKMALKFAKNGLKNSHFAKLFPLRRIKHEMVARNSEKYHINRSNTVRYKDSAVPFLQRLLNKDNLETKLCIKRLFDGKISTNKAPVGAKKRKIG